MKKQFELFFAGLICFTYSIYVLVDQSPFFLSKSGKAHHLTKEVFEKLGLYPFSIVTFIIGLVFMIAFMKYGKETVVGDGKPSTMEKYRSTMLVIGAVSLLAYTLYEILGSFGR